MNDDRQGNEDDAQPKGRAPDTGGGELNRLAPPAFPPGQRVPPRRNHRPHLENGAEPEGEVPADAFISPDEPIMRTDSRFAPDAFISPDEPLPPRGTADVDADEGVVTGIGDDPHLGAENLTFVHQGDPAVADLALRVGRLADALRAKGEAALRTTSDMSRFEATLRAYCVGYLAARRDEGNA